jgi:predicted dehydrogenase
VTGVVVAGTGFGCFTHVRALRSAGFEVRAVVGRDPEKTAARARAFEVPEACTSLGEAMQLDGVDAVTIATPPHTHAPLALEAIAAGKHVLCEKPFARDAAEGQGIVDAAQRAGIVHLLGTEYRFDTGQALLARVIGEGRIGAPRLGMFVLHVPVLAEDDAELPVWWADASQGGGWLGAHGSQVIDQIRVTLGEFTSVTAAVVHIAERDATADDGFVVHFVLDNGCVGVMQSTAADRGPMIIETRVIGSEGSAWIDGLGDTVKVATSDGTATIPIPDDLRTTAPIALPAGVLETTYEQMIGHGMDLGAYTRLAEHFRAAVEGTSPPPGPRPATFVDGVIDMSVLDAMRRSAAERRTAAVS